LSIPLSIDFAHHILPFFFIIGEVVRVQVPTMKKKMKGEAKMQKVAEILEVSSLQKLGTLLLSPISPTSEKLCIVSTPLSLYPT
jgi:hypothetical protein